MASTLTQPTIITIPWASSGNKRAIPTTSQIFEAGGDGKASWPDGYPPLCGTPLASGGKPPSILDENGVLFEVTNNLRFLLGGGRPKFNADMASAIGGYPVGAILQDNAGVNTYINVVDGNSVDFNSTSSAIGVSWLLHGSASSLKTQYMVVHEEKGPAIPAGPSVVGVNVRDLNTVVSNTIPGASLGSKRITLPAGSYFVDSSAPGMGNGHKLYFYNVTAGATSILGTAENSMVSAGVDASNPVWTRSFCKGIITLNIQSVFELRHYFSEESAAGLGNDVITTQNAVYSEIIIDKVLV